MMSLHISPPNSWTLTINQNPVLNKQRTNLSSAKNWNPLYCLAFAVKSLQYWAAGFVPIKKSVTIVPEMQSLKNKRLGLTNLFESQDPSLQKSLTSRGWIWSLIFDMFRFRNWECISNAAVFSNAQPSSSFFLLFVVTWK